ncbi:hypothetical protein M153_1200005298 [Pseudoloma neurophilia]|uniref:Uncharacterized protein n=1 Tax=Pseudoloma neurophilia TaxID=146866 RepID=A0A0R0M6Z9_9MICR|nr:hypothetical protein M153_1200005298 [Pseudoloma neurophilia]
MRFIRSEKSPFVLILKKDKTENTLDRFNILCSKISEQLTIIREMIDTTDFPTDEIKNLIDMLQDLKEIDLPYIRIPYTALSILEKKEAKELLQEELEKRELKERVEQETRERELKFLELLENQDFNLK